MNPFASSPSSFNGLLLELHVVLASGPVVVGSGGASLELGGLSLPSNKIEPSTKIMIHSLLTVFKPLQIKSSRAAIGCRLFLPVDVD